MVAVILSKESVKSLIGHNPVSGRILKVTIRAKPYNISLFQCYSPTVTASDVEMEDFYSMLQESINNTQNRDITIVMGDFNAKIGKLSNNSNICGIYGPGDQNERGANLLEFCSVNNLAVVNTIVRLMEMLARATFRLL